MAKHKSKEKRLKSLYKQLKKVKHQSVLKSSYKFERTGPNPMDETVTPCVVMTMKGRLLERIKTLENGK